MVMKYNDEERAARMRRIRRAEYARRRRDPRGRFLPNFSALPRDRFLTIRLTEPEEAAIKDLAAEQGADGYGGASGGCEGLQEALGRVKGGRAAATCEALDTPEA